MQQTLDQKGGRSLPNLHVHEFDPGPDRFSDAVLEGLSRPAKSLPFRFLYDAEGSRLFEQICRQPEYYPTRTEIRILQDVAAQIAALSGPNASLVELGSGAGRKIGILLNALRAPAAYLPVDISRAALVPAGKQIALEYPELPVHAVWADFSARFELPLTGDGRVVGFFPGSSIGNFTRAAATEFLASWRKRLGPGSAMIVGVDLIKPVHILEAAYNDAAGVTAAFSLNVLRRANRELGADFEIENFVHEAHYNPNSFAIDIHLRSLADQLVTISGQQFRFSEDEMLHVESSHKYDVDGFVSIASLAGFDHVQTWVDENALFSVHFLTAQPV